MLSRWPRHCRPMPAVTPPHGAPRQQLPECPLQRYPAMHPAPCPCLPPWHRLAMPAVRQQLPPAVHLSAEGTPAPCSFKARLGSGWRLGAATARGRSPLRLWHPCEADSSQSIARANFKAGNGCVQCTQFRLSCIESSRCRSSMEFAQRLLFSY